jgi:hypothetical protein
MHHTTFPCQNEGAKNWEDHSESKDIIQKKMICIFQYMMKYISHHKHMKEDRQEKLIAIKKKRMKG